jgi:hypothetical protein
MSGSTGADRVKSRADFDKFLLSYDNIISKFPGFVSLHVSGSYNSDFNKTSFGDIDIIVHVESAHDKPTVKKELVVFFNQMPDSVIVPFTSVKHSGKKTYNTGELVTVRYYDKQLGYSVQIDNIIALDSTEALFKKQFLDLPAAKQGIILGLVKVAAIETAPSILFAKLGIEVDSELPLDQEYEFNLSSVELQLRRVSYVPGTFNQLNKEILWTSKNFEDLRKLLYQYNLSLSFDELLTTSEQVLTNPRSGNRIQGIFKSMITVKSGEIGTMKEIEKNLSLSKIESAFTHVQTKICNFIS